MEAGVQQGDRSADEGVGFEVGDGHNCASDFSCYNRREHYTTRGKLENTRSEPYDIFPTNLARRNQRHPVESLQQLPGNNRPFRIPPNAKIHGFERPCGG
jgi:hypothetical protein